MITNRQVKAARALLGWSTADLALHAGLPEATVARLEQIEGPLGGRDHPGQRLILALQKAGAIFLEEDDVGSGVGLRRARRRDEGLRPDQLTTDNDG